MAEWRFYGRQTELRQLVEVFNRGRWFFVKIAGRRRIGKTALIREALKQVPDRPVLYVQIPDSGEAGVLSAVADALSIFEIPPSQVARPHRMADLALMVETLARDGFVVVLDEFQYFNRKPYVEFCSLLQAVVDRLAASAGTIPGGLVVLGSIHTEMTALLEDRSAPLYNRLTDSLELSHLDTASLLELLREQADDTPERLLFLWTMFEGVPKYYRDCFEQKVLQEERRSLLRRIFFESSSPLRTEAENNFLRELKGRHDTVLKFVARHPGRMHGELLNEIRRFSLDGKEQIGSYLTTLTERYRLIERKLPVFAPPEARKSRYYLSDNFLQAWLAALANPVAARDFRPLEGLVAEADDRLAQVEGFGLERLVAQIYEERSRKGIAGFPLTARINGYWDRGDVEIDLVAINETEERIRFGSCKRSPAKLLSDVNNFRSHVESFLGIFPEYRSWQIELVGISPRLGPAERDRLSRYEMIPQDLVDLTAGLV